MFISSTLFIQGPNRLMEESITDLPVKESYLTFAEETLCLSQYNSPF